MTDDLTKLIIQAQNGNKDAFGEIYRLFLKRIYRFIYYSVYDYEPAQDLTQNTFLKAWRSLSSFSPNRGSFQAFLFTIARNVVIDYYREQKAHRSVSYDKVDDVLASENSEEALYTEEKKKFVYEALSILNDLEKQMIILRYFEELQIGEIAIILGMREGATRVRIHRILKRLRKYLQEEKQYGS